MLLRLPIKRRHPTQQNIQNHAKGPHINLYSVGALENLRCNVEGSSIDIVHHLFLAESSGQAKID